VWDWDEKGCFSPKEFHVVAPYDFLLLDHDAAIGVCLEPAAMGASARLEPFKDFHIDIRKRPVGACIQEHKAVFDVGVADTDLDADF
jgi:hypothetical protein